MPEIGGEGGDDLDRAEQLARDADVLKNAWSETLDEMNAMGDDYEQQGWNAICVPAGDTAPRPPEIDDKEYYGIVHVIPDNFADEIEAVLPEGEFAEYDVFRREIDGRVFFVTEFRDTATETVILVAGQYMLMDAAALIDQVREDGYVETYLKRLNEEIVGKFEHEDPEKFFPHYHQFEQYFDSDSV
jgi:L-rhamnose mutarotase